GKHVATTVSLTALVAVLLTAVLGERQARSEEKAAAKPALVVCAQPAAMPRTGRAADGSAQGLDAAVAELLGRELGRKVEFHWCASASCSWKCLAAGRCEVVLGL